MGTKKKENENQLAIFLRDRRIKADLSQKDVANSLGYSSAQFISNWERGLSSPPLDSLKKLSEVLEIKPKELINVILQETKLELEKNLYQSSAKGYQKPKQRTGTK